MTQQHSIVIKNNHFRPSNLRIQIGDSVIWDNQDDHDHTATSNYPRVAFDTGVIAAGTASRPVIFDTISSYGGVNFYCKLHALMLGRLVVRAAAPPSTGALSAPSAAPAQAPGLTYSTDVWLTIARIVAVHWVYDMSDDFGRARRTHRGPALDQLNAEWALVESFWNQQTGSTKTILDGNGRLDPTAFENESLENLDALGRRIRLAKNKLLPTVIVSQFPLPFRPDAVRHFGEHYPGQSDLPFGEAITINYVGVPVG